MACPGPGCGSGALGEHARGPGQRRAGREPGCGGGAVVKTDPIGEGEDDTAAQSQSAAMAKAKVSLRAAVGSALRGNAGFRAVSVTPSLRDGRAVAEVALAKGEEVKTVSVPL